jgi:hypothetical protein
MGTLVFVCPTTGHSVSTGVELDRATFKSLPRITTELSCPRCGHNHLLARVWSWLESVYPDEQTDRTVA